MARSSEQASASLVTSGALADRVWAGPDLLRTRVYRWCAPWLGGLYANRDRRVLWLGVFTVASSFAFTVAAPLWLLTLGPLVLGVPHLLADVRYLVVRPRLHRQRSAWLAAAGLLAVGVGATPVWGVLAAVPLVLASSAAWWRRGAVLLAVATLAVVAFMYEREFLLGFVHAHNVIALALWWSVRRRARDTLVVLGLVCLAAVVLVTGQVDGLITTLGGWEAPASGTSFDDFMTTNAPFADGRLAAHLVLSFAFLQSVHYGVWLRLIPDDARVRPAPRPFAASWRALVNELGVWPMVLVSALGIGIAMWGAVDPGAARLGYLRLGAFHGYLELAVVAWLLTGKRDSAQ